MEPIEEDDHSILSGMSAFERSIECTSDCTLVPGVLIVFSPLFLLCYITVKREDGGPATFKQKRTGRFGCPLDIYRLRSMELDVEKHGPVLYTGEGDSRMTKIGYFLHDYHPDEFPQPRNVFCDDMAFIGPRPERQFFIDQIMREDPCYRYLFQIRPGVTPYAAPRNNYTDTLGKTPRHLCYDLFYLEHHSWGFDIKILFMAFMSIVSGKRP